MSGPVRPYTGALAAGLAAFLMLAFPAAWATEASSSMPRPLKVFRPEYPKAAIVDDIEGWVDVEFTVTAEGTVRDVIVVEADPPRVFDRAAVRAVSRWIYQPAQEGGVAVERRIREHIVFQP